MKRFFTLFLVLICLINIPISLIGNETGIFKDPDPEPTDSIITENENTSLYNQDYLKGIEDAQKTVKKSPLFFFSGFCLGLVGVLIPFVITFDPPPEKLVNKSISYVIGFKDQYNKSMRSANGKLAIIGLVSFYAAYILIYIVVLIVSLSWY
ncbi:hypothetical protein KAU15_05840 [candidate division WOR-3 bacterium]|nr:hypothetical protein [candidate division WOR-3 bacterium]